MVPPHPTLIPQRTGGGLFAPEHYKFKRLVVDHSSGTTARRPNGLSDKYMEHAKSIFHTDHSVFDGSEEVCVTAHLIGRSLATSLSQAGKFLTLRVNIGPKHVLADGTIRRSLDLDCPGNLFRADPSSHLLFDGKTGKPVDGNWGFLPVHWKAVADEVGMKDDRDFEEIAPGDVFPFHLVTLDNAEITRVVYEVQDPFIPPTPSPSSSSLANDEKEEASSAQHQTDGLIREGVQHDLEDQDAPSSEQHQSDDLIEEGADHNVANPTPESDPGPQNAPTPQTNVPRQGSLHTIQGIDSRIVWCTANPVLAEYELLGKLLARVENKSAWPPYQTNLYDYLQPRVGHLHEDAFLNAPRKTRRKVPDQVEANDSTRTTQTAPTRCGKPPSSPPTTRSKTKARTIAAARTVDHEGPTTRSKTNLFPDVSKAQGNGGPKDAPPTKTKKSEPTGVRTGNRSEKARAGSSHPVAQTQRTREAGPSKTAAPAQRKRATSPIKSAAPARVSSQKSVTHADQTQGEDKKGKRRVKFTTS